MEQEGRIGCRSSIAPFAHLFSIFPGLHYQRTLRVGVDFEDARILLRKHELHEFVLQDHGALLQM
jgi:hypothetical protein